MSGVRVAVGLGDSCTAVGRFVGAGVPLSVGVKLVAAIKVGVGVAFLSLTFRSVVFVGGWSVVLGDCWRRVNHKPAMPNTTATTTPINVHTG